MTLRSRRRFLTLALLGLVGLSAGGWLARWWFRPGRDALHADLMALYAQLPELPQSGVIADDYLRQVPRDADPKVLRVALLGPAAGANHRPQDVHERLAETIRNDYSQRRTITIRGWVISQTEARLCVLARLAR